VPALPLFTDYTDRVNARILAVSEDRIAGFVREPFLAIAEQSGDASGWDDPEGAPDADRHQPRRRGAGGVARAGGTARRGIRAAEIKPSEISPALYRDWFTRMKG